MSNKEYKEVKLKAWVVTTLGGKNLFFQDYSGRLPVFYTKKEAERELALLEENDRPGEKRKRELYPNKFRRNILRCEINYTAPIHLP